VTPVPEPAVGPAIVGAPTVPSAASPAPSVESPRVTPAPAASRSDPSDSALIARFVQDSAADAVALDQLAQAHAPDARTGDPLDALAESGAARLDLTTWADHDRVRFYLDFFQGPARGRMAVWLTRLPVYEGMVRDRFAAEGLPGDLVYLGLIESGLSNVAVSRSRAVGMWQFMRPTARWMGLRVDRWVDERRDPVKATDAAARYLAKLTGQFGSVYLAAAAYNGGPGTVSRGLDRLDVAPGPGPGNGDGSAEAVAEDEDDEVWSDEDFFTLAGSRYIRQETRDYVPKLIAAALIARDPIAYGFAEVPLVPVWPRDSLVVPDMTGLDVVARLAGVPTETIRELNPHYLRLVTPPATKAVVRLPTGSMETVATAYASLPPRERVRFRTHDVRSGETMSGIAKRYGVSTAAVQDANPKVRPSRLRIGQTLVIPVGGGVKWTDPEPASVSRRTHTVRSGETLSGIAKRYRVSTSQLVAWNNLSSSGKIRAGQKLRVTGTSSRAATASAAPVAKASNASAQTHVVRSGETLSGLARRYGVSVQALRQANQLASADQIRIGQKLRIPA
jgi:membrane-bound lytic murein transglycosylase D